MKQFFSPSLSSSVFRDFSGAHVIFQVPTESLMIICSVESSRGAGGMEVAERMGQERARPWEYTYTQFFSRWVFRKALLILVFMLLESDCLSNPRYFRYTGNPTGSTYHSVFATSDSPACWVAVLSYSCVQMAGVTFSQMAFPKTASSFSRTHCLRQEHSTATGFCSLDEWVSLLLLLCNLKDGSNFSGVNNYIATTSCYVISNNEGLGGETSSIQCSKKNASLTSEWLQNM